jgi:hypothetical protein
MAHHGGFIEEDEDDINQIGGMRSEVFVDGKMHVTKKGRKIKDNEGKKEQPNHGKAFLSFMRSN